MARKNGELFLSLLMDHCENVNVGDGGGCDDYANVAQAAYVYRQT